MIKQPSILLRHTVGDAIRKQRLQQGLSLRKFSLMVNVSYPYLDKIENGKVAMTIDVLEKIANGLGCKPQDLFPE